MERTRIDDITPGLVVARGLDRRCTHPKGRDVVGIAPQDENRNRLCPRPYRGAVGEVLIFISGSSSAKARALRAASASEKGFLVTQDDYSKDILNAVADLKKNGFVDPTRITCWCGPTGEARQCRGPL